MRGFDLAVTAGPAERGRLALIAVFSQGDVPVAECRSLYQPPGPRTKGDKVPSAGAPVGPAIAEATWTLAPDEGWRYARISGDFNPIHLSPWLARPFGFDRPILHGMAIVGRVAALAEREAGRSATTVSARFRRPMRLPGELRVAYDASGGYRVTSADGETLHLDGACSFGD
jgi:acyl dehydratase